ncbi:MAG: anthrone oxygenase family protein [Pseudomonadota bacterium]
MSMTLILLIQFSTLAYAFIGGVFLAFSDFIMRSLAQTEGHGGLEAMQAINREVFHWIFMALFLGMAALSLVVAGFGAFALTGLGGKLIMLSGLVYLTGCFGVTVFCNIPMNEALAGMTAASESTRDYWLQTYVPRWTFWNSVRTTACAISAALLFLGLICVLQ